MIRVSVPCRGLIGFYKLKIRNTEGSENGFRPLSGSYRFLLIMQVETMLNEEIGFRPLSGSYKFLFEEGSAYLKENVFVPCRGLISFYVHERAPYDTAACGFRPLSGSYKFLYSRVRS